MFLTIYNETEGHRSEDSEISANSRRTMTTFLSKVQHRKKVSDVT